MEKIGGFNGKMQENVEKLQGKYGKKLIILIKKIAKWGKLEGKT